MQPWFTRGGLRGRTEVLSESAWCIAVIRQDSRSGRTPAGRAPGGGER